MAFQIKHSRIAKLSPGRSGIGMRGESSTTGPAMEGHMNPLDSITGTIVSGVILALLLAALF